MVKKGKFTQRSVWTIHLISKLKCIRTHTESSAIILRYKIFSLMCDSQENIENVTIVSLRKTKTVCGKADNWLLLVTSLQFRASASSMYWFLCQTNHNITDKVLAVTQNNK